MAKSSFLDKSPFFIRLLHWEYWPFNLVYIPVSIYYLWLSIKARSLFFFSTSNPSIETGGMFGESKYGIFKLLPHHTYPITILVEEGTSFDEVKIRMVEKKLTYPLIAKPDRGERGWLVSKIENEVDLKSYHAKVKIDFLLQAYVDLPLELSIFYYRFPDAANGIISSMVSKEMLEVTGDGKSTIRELILSYPRALLQLPVLQVELAAKMSAIPAMGEKVVLVPIGNHSRGAKFIDACHLIDDELTKAIDDLSKQIPGFYFGRYDLRCESLDSLKKGTGYQVMELNGAGAEPAHIYHPGYSLIKAYKVLFHHFHVLYQISQANHKKGLPYMSLKEYRAMQKLIKAYRQKGNA